MNSIYKITLIVICLIFIRKLLSKFNNRIDTPEACTNENNSTKENNFATRNINSTDLNQKETIVSDEKSEQILITTKNSFLNPDDNFGTLTKGKVFNSIVYDYEMNDNSNKDKMKIRTIKKKKS